MTTDSLCKPMKDTNWPASQSYKPGDRIQGAQAIGFILDENSKFKPVKKRYNTIGVRFIYGHTLEKVYTYRVAKGVKLHLGQEIIAPSAHGKRIVVVVEIHKTPQDNGGFNYLFVEQKVASL